jgi:TPR repeat protein
MEVEMVRTMPQAFRSIQSDSPQAILDGYAFLFRRILRGDATALDALGSMLTFGVGVEKNARLAAACYAAASRAYAGAKYNLASALIEGHGIPKDMPKGLRLLRAARRAGRGRRDELPRFLLSQRRGREKGRASRV